MVEREKFHQEMYLKMYEKGQKTAQIERQEEVNYIQPIFTFSLKKIIIK